MSRPLIGIAADVKLIGLSWFHAVGKRYVEAVQTAVGDVVILPSLGNPAVLERMLPLLDGIFLTGSLSNVEPQQYGEPPSREGTLHDPERDATALPLIRTAVDIGMPLFGVCRGLQEINVAFGGTLHQHIQELPQKMDHREPQDVELEQMYADAHDIRLAEDSLLRRWLGGADSIAINSLHQQGVKELGQGLSVEAVAEDGIIEAFRIDAARHFGYAVQWHPEWLFNEKPASVALFKAFKEACEAYRAGKS